MNTIKFLAVLTLALLITTSNAQSKDKITNKSDSRIEVLDFHSTHRCMTCNAIEANTKYTLDKYFSKEMKASKITFKVINVDDEKNEKMAEKFEVSGTALILNVIKGGKETHIDLTDFAFMKGNDKKAFSKELKAKIEAELKAL